VTPDGRRLISGSADDSLKIWDVERETLLYTLRGHTAPVRALAVTPDGEWCISASDDGQIKIWNLTLGMEQCTLSGHGGPVHGLA
jgi:WD40 repeat protein